MPCLVVAQQRGRKGVIISDWKMPFLALAVTVLAASAARHAPLRLFAVSNAAEE